MGGCIMINPSDFLKNLLIFGVKVGGSSGAVHSISGTAGQIDASSPTGNVVLSLDPAVLSKLFVWNPLSGNTQTAVVNNGYVALNAGRTTITLPAVAAFGSIVKVAGHGAGGWLLAPGAGQTILTVAGTASTSITSAGANDTIEVLCIVADTTWLALPATSTGLIIA